MNYQNHKINQDRLINAQYAFEKANEIEDGTLAKDPFILGYLLGQDDGAIQSIQFVVKQDSLLANDLAKELRKDHFNV